MDSNKSIALLNRKFWYMRDKWPSYRILHGDEQMFWAGDCKDYALTLSWLCAGRRLWLFVLHQVICFSVLWVVRTDKGELHTALWHKGRWADNISDSWTDSCAHAKLFPVPFPIVWFGMALAILPWLWTKLTFSRSA